MAEINYKKVDLLIIDEQNKYEEGKDTKVNLRYDSDKGYFRASTIVNTKVDNTPNDDIFASDKISLKIKLHKNGRLGPSGEISKKMAEEKGLAVIEEEYAKAARAICKHFGVIK